MNIDQKLNICRFAVCILCAFLMFAHYDICSRADFDYSAACFASGSNELSGSSASCEYTAAYPICWIKSGDGWNGARLAVLYNGYVQDISGSSASVFFPEVSLIDGTLINASGSTTHFNRNYYGNWYCGFSDPSLCGGYVFTSTSAATAYFVNGDESGMLQSPPHEYDFNTDHDFSNDVYETDIPVPQLIALSYNGFEVDNAQEGLYLDLYIDTAFYGVQHDSGAQTSYSINKNMLVNSHRYNMTNYDLAYDRYDYDIAELYGVDMVADLIADFRTWSNMYPSHKDLPDYNFFKHGTGAWTNDYNLHHTFTNNAYNDDTDKLKYSNQAVVTYYVRFYTMRNGEVVYGKWISYTYNRTSTTSSSLAIGDVAAKADGTPEPTNTYQMYQDNAGNATFANISQYSQATTSVDTSTLRQSLQGIIDLIATFPTFVDQYSNFSRFLVASFSFIPPSIWLIINLAFQLFLAMLALRILMKFL